VKNLRLASLVLYLIGTIQSCVPLFSPPISNSFTIKTWSFQRP